MIFLFGCSVPVNVSGDCSLLEITEIRANRPVEVPEEYTFVGREDYVEVHNPSEEPLDIAGFQLHGNQSEQPWFVVPEPCELPAGGYQVFLATLYDDGADPCGEGSTPSTFFDLNNDGDAVYLRDPWGQTCSSEVVLMPDQHAGFVWERDPESPLDWCPAAPSPGDSNPPCLCGSSDGC